MSQGMLQAFVITLREGLEAFLIVAISIALAAFLIGGEILAIADIRLYNFDEPFDWIYDGPVIMIIAYLGRFGWIALLIVTLPYVLQLAKKGFERAVRENPGLAEGVNVRQGEVTNPAVAATFNLPCAPVTAA